MIQIRANDLIAIKEGNKYYYAYIITKIKHFGGNLIYGFHRTSDSLLNSEDLLDDNTDGFMAFVDLIWAKRDDAIIKLDKNISLPYAADPEKYRQAWPDKETEGYKIRLFDGNCDFICEYKVKNKSEISEEVLSLPEYMCSQTGNFFEYVNRSWHQSKIEDIWPNN